MNRRMWLPPLLAIIILISLNTAVLAEAGFTKTSSEKHNLPTNASVIQFPINLEADSYLMDEGFEGGKVPPSGWSEVVTNHSYNWSIWKEGDQGTSHSGSFAAQVDYDDNPQDEWLLSPPMTLAGGVLSFWSYGSIYYCRDVYNNCDLLVWIVVGSPGGGDDVLLGKADDAWPASWTWAQTTFDLTPFLPVGLVRIGFEYLGNDGAQVILDDITIVGTTGSHSVFLPFVIKAPLNPNTPPAAPSGLVTAAVSPYAINLSWSDNANNEISYDVQRSPDGSTWTGVATLPANSTSWQDIGLAPDTLYYYQVGASNSAGNSPYSNTSSASRPPGSAVCNGDFEQGTTCWTQYSKNGWPLILDDGFPEGISPHGGTWLAWLGGDFDEVSYIQQHLTVPTSSPFLAYYHWIDSLDSCGNDFVKVIVNSSIEVDLYDLCSSQNTGGWVNHVVDLSAYAGQSILLRIQAQTNGSNNSHLYLDDFSFQSGSILAESEIARTGMP